MSEIRVGSKLLERSLKIGLACIGFFLVLSVGAYLTVFHDGLSRAPDNWSAFGSFFGGIFGPVVSLVTLFAILITIDLQKRLLSNQAQEFESLSALQRLSHQAQVDQANFSKLSDYKSHQLQLIDQLLNMFEKMQDRYNLEAERVKASSELLGTKQNHLVHMDAAIQDMENVASKLIQLSMEVSLREFDNIEAIKYFVMNRLVNTHHFFSSMYAEATHGSV